MWFKNLAARCFLIMLHFQLFTVFSARAQYFPMYDIEMQFSREFLLGVPETNINYPLANILTVPLLINEKNSHLRLDKENPLLQIDPRKGQLYFKEGVKKLANSNLEWPDVINATVVAGHKLNATFQMYNLPRHTFGVAKLSQCSNFLSDLCFWHSVKYQLMENSDPVVLGTLSSPYFIRLCKRHEINYTLSKGGEYFVLESIDSVVALKSAKQLNRDNNGAIVDIEIVCSVNNLNDKSSKVNVSRIISINILDANDNLPVPQERHIDVYLLRDFVKEGEEVQVNNLIFRDLDSLQVNGQYKFEILNDTLHLLRLNCNSYEYDVTDEAQTVVHCKLFFTKNMRISYETYTVMVQITDVNLVGRVLDADASVNTSVRFILPRAKVIQYDKRNATGSIYLKLNVVKILRSAAPYARIAEPKPLNNARNKRENFTIVWDSIGSSNLPSGVFNVTATEGIVYVQNSSLLKNNSNDVSVTIQCDFIRLNGSSRRQLQDTLYLTLVGDSKETCLENYKRNLWDYPHCADKKSPKSCMSTCGIGTGGTSSIVNFGLGKSKYCVWRGDKHPGNEHTTEYATCTPNTEHCPNGVCDSLEDLHHLICPQDCSRDVHFPTMINSKTGRGISGGKGICVCDYAEKCSCYMTAAAPPPAVKKQDKQLLKQTNLSAHHRSQNTPMVVQSSSGGSSYPVKVDDRSNVCGTQCIASIVFGGVLLLAAMCGLLVCWCRSTTNKRRTSFKDSAAQQSMIVHETQYNNIVVPTEMTSLFSASNSLINPEIVDAKWEFPRQKLFIEQTLGEGEFGKVLRARALDIAGNMGYITVAVKTLKDGASSDELSDLLSEYELLKQVSHPNVIRLLGASTLPGGPVYLIIEFAENGCLRNYLRKSRGQPVPGTENGRVEVTAKDILAFAWQISKGMAYLSDMKLVHRDLATRNILVAADKVCKVSDFGLTRDVYQDDAYLKRSKGRVPVKWMAPESLADHIYTSKSDVWSFGVVIWELVTLGASPYPGVAAQNLYYLIRSGYRMEKPDNCSDAIYRVMQRCWQEDPNSRPSFRSLSLQWEQMLSDGVEYLDLNCRVVQNRAYFDGDTEVTPTVAAAVRSKDINYLAKFDANDVVKCSQVDDKLANILNDVQQELCHYESPVKCFGLNESYIDMATRNRYENTSI